MSSDAAAYFANRLADASDIGEVADERHHSHDEAIGNFSIAETTDEQLLSQVGLGSRDALGLLFRRHARAVFHVAWRILRDESEADDLRQEVFLYLSQRSQYFDAQKGSGASWIMQVTYHRAIDRRRYLDFRQHYSTEEFDEQRMPTTAAQPSPDALDGRAIRDRLREQLTEAQQQTLELHFFEGYSFREIAERNGQTVGNVRHHYYRALERLRSHLFPQKRG
ncbi:RNA polymerase sigma factor [Edaphobacter aggregans]|uniref:RNA polymerase sigma factor n=1 Tax=Edaphobacter aggregans TaxID=570835 RepID=UPI0005553A7E|nr:sigma-70 family RNA polymerase sigma factor [Edaphobacter aggregans]